MALVNPEISIKGVHIDRSVKPYQSELGIFANAVQQRLGRDRASVFDANRRHLTIAESFRLKQALARLRSRQSAGRSIISPVLFDALNHNRSRCMEVEIDPDEPIVLVGFERTKLALNVVYDERLQEERAKTEELLNRHFYRLPELKPLWPHITFGKITEVNKFSYRDLRHPERLLGSIEPPETLALNGLRVYLDGMPLMREPELVQAELVPQAAARTKEI